MFFKGVDFLIGSVVRRRRKEKRLTQLELSRRLHVDQTHISKIEGDLASPSLELLVQLVRELDISGLEVLDALGIPLCAQSDTNEAESGPERSLDRIISTITDLEQNLAVRSLALQRDSGELAALRETAVRLRSAVEERVAGS